MYAGILFLKDVFRRFLTFLAKIPISHFLFTIISVEMHTIDGIFDFLFVIYDRSLLCLSLDGLLHDDVIKWKHFPRNWPFVRGIHRSPVNSPRKGQWRGALMFSLICIWINGWVNNREAGDLRRHRAHYDVIVIFTRNGYTLKDSTSFSASCQWRCISMFVYLTFYCYMWQVSIVFESIDSLLIP